MWSRARFMVTGMWENKTFCASYLTKFSMNFDLIWFVVETGWFDELPTRDILSNQYLGERTHYRWFCFRKQRTTKKERKKMSSTLSCIQMSIDWCLSNLEWWRSPLNGTDTSYNGLTFLQGHSYTGERTPLRWFQNVFSHIWTFFF